MAGTWAATRLSPKSWAAFCWSCRRGEHFSLRREARRWIRRHREDTQHADIRLLRCRYEPERDRRAERALRARQLEIATHPSGALGVLADEAAEAELDVAPHLLGAPPESTALGGGRI